jgi:glutamate/tyrosine decarboxylase-like PLP-dependent enzyme
LVGLTVARTAKAEIDINQLGVAAAPRPMTLYASTETHNSVTKAAALLGLGREALRLIRVDADFRIDLSELKRAIAADRAEGKLPFCVVGNAGTVNTGAFDDLQALGDLCRQENLWFHVDGAFGAFAAVVPSRKHAVAGMGEADSLAFDLHKFMYVPFEAGCAMVRDSDAHRRAFAVSADYLVHAQRGPAGGNVWFTDYGVQLSRGFRALKVWMSLKEHGARKYAAAIAQNVDQARYLAGLVESNDRLQLLAPTSFNIVCFRYAAAGMADALLDRVNEELLLELQEQGIALPSSTRINGRFAIRVCITNHRTRRADLDLLVNEVDQRGERLATSLK